MTQQATNGLDHTSLNCYFLDKYRITLMPNFYLLLIVFILSAVAINWHITARKKLKDYTTKFNKDYMQMTKEQWLGRQLSTSSDSFSYNDDEDAS